MSWTKPLGCDTFVVLPPATADGFVVFGKNSDRPGAEVQEITYAAGAKHPDGSKLKCTYVEIHQVGETFAVVLSKPAWMWGAEMGANEFGVVIGNEAVWTKLDEDSQERLLGMDLLRLGLERSKTAESAVGVISGLLERYGQGGPCAEDMPSMTYHNSFLIADSKEAWVLETADRVWVAEKVESGVRNISNCLSITTKIDRKSANLEQIAIEKCGWNGQDPMNFAVTFSQDSSDGQNDFRYSRGRQLLQKYSINSESSIVNQSISDLLTRLVSDQFDANHMMSVLRDENCGICMRLGGSFVSTSSQVSVLSEAAKVHFFTGTPDPISSGFKPFVFGPKPPIWPKEIVSPTYADSEDPAKILPRFKKEVDRRHKLYRSHQEAFGDAKGSLKVRELLSTMESACVNEILANLRLNPAKLLEDSENLFKDCVEAEVKIYR